MLIYDLIYKIKKVIAIAAGQKYFYSNWFEICMALCYYIFGKNMKKINQAELEQSLLSHPFIILDFSSPGCAPCQRISQALPGLLAELPGMDIAAYEVDIAAEPAVASKFFVLGVPTVILFKNGQEIARFNSLPKSGKLKQLLS